MVSELERKRSCPLLLPERGAPPPVHPSAVKSEASAAAAGAVRASVNMRMRVPGGACAGFQPNPELWLLRPARHGTSPPTLLGSLLSIHRTDGETGGQQPDRLRLLVALNHSAIYIMVPSSPLMDSAAEGPHPPPEQL